MRAQDQRSRRIALVPDRLLNAHLLPSNSAERDTLVTALDLLERLGFGLIQLPPHDLPTDRARAALDFALDQLQDYARHGYRLVRIDLPHLPESGVWRTVFDAGLACRGLPPVHVVLLEDAAAFESSLRRSAFPPAGPSATMPAEAPSRGKASP